MTTSEPLRLTATTDNPETLQYAHSSFSGQQPVHPQYISDSEKPQAKGHLRNAIDRGDNPSHAPVQPEDRPPKDFKEFLKRFEEKLIKEDGGSEAGRKRLAETYVDEKHLGWYGYINWHDNEEMRTKAETELETHVFTQPPEFQAGPLPTTNPILLGHRFKEYHSALGPNLEKMAQESWTIINEDKASDILHVLDFPNNCEPPRDKLMESHITPIEYHFVRNHGGIPTMEDVSKYSFAVKGLVGREGRMTLQELQNPAFEHREVPITLQCSGTRRIEQIELYSGLGDELLSAPWAEGAIGTAVYKGVTLKSVLDYFGGVKKEGLHVEAIGADTYFKKGKLSNYAVSIPYRKAKHEDVLLAYEMNGKPLPRSHGGPLRLIVPGFIGARSTKWLVSINVLNEPSRGVVQREEYLYWNSQIGKHNETPANGFSIQAMPVSSALLVPGDSAVVIHDGKIRCEGWAYTGGTDTWVERVEVSADGGFVWYEVPEENMSPKWYGCKRLWHLDLPVQAEGWLELVVRAHDDALKTQPTYVRAAWQWGLHITSSAHRVKVYSVNRSRPETAKRLELFESKGVPFEPLTRPTPFPVLSPEEYETAMKAKGSREPEPFEKLTIRGDGQA